MDSTDILQAALNYAAHGWHIFPVRGKQPAEVRSWTRESTTDPKQIAAWFAGSSGLGIGVDLGKSKLAVIDGDDLAKMPQELRDALDASGAWTHRGQRHRQSWVFSENGHAVKQAMHAWGEVKAGGGYIVVAPSPHPSGIHYEWVASSGREPPVLPPSIEAMVARVRKAVRAAAVWDGEPPTQEETDEALATLERVSERFSQAEEGGRNRQLNNAALILGHLVPHYLDEQWVIDALTTACKKNGLWKDDGEEQCLATIYSGLGAGTAEPRKVEMLPRLDVEALFAEMDEDERSAPKKPTRLLLTKASDIAPKRAKWLWQGRMAVGSLSILAGREGVGKSTLAYWLVAQVTKGLLPGESKGRPRAVLVVATEDAWAETIVPRLIAAGADLDLVYRMEVATEVGVAELTLPTDIAAVGEAADELDAALLLLDPLMSRLSAKLDTHRDAEVRVALEPLTKMCFAHGLAAVGLMHFNKSGSDDPMNALMASRAFAAVARSVSTVVKDPDDDTDTRRLFGTPKNNLGPTNLPLLSFIVQNTIVPTDDGDANVGRIEWLGEVQESVSDVLRRSQESGHDKTATQEAADWLADYLDLHHGSAESADIKRAGQRAGHNAEAIRRARKKLQIVATSSGFPRTTKWWAPDAHAAHLAEEAMFVEEESA